MCASRDELPELFAAAIRGSDWGDLRSTVVSMPAGTGDLYYVPSGHTAIVEEDFESVEFSPPAAHEHVLEVIKRNAAMAETARV